MIYLLSWTLLFALALTLPLLALVFFWLAERYSATVAYVVLALVPPLSFALILKFQQYMGHWPNTLLPETLWLSLLTFIFGIALVVRALRKNQGWAVLLTAAVVSLAPFALVVFMLYQMSQDQFLKSL